MRAPLTISKGVVNIASSGFALDRIYLTFCAPILLALIYILPPFQAPDEAAHFYRAVQISHGEISPVLAYNAYRQGAGGAVDQSAYELVDRRCGIPNWTCKNRTRPGLVDLLRRPLQRRNGDPRHVVAFSNTVVYLPLAHVVPAAAISIARWSGFSALGWLYAGRLANMIFATGVSWLALRLLRFERAALLVFAVATLPMVISVVPTLTADSGVISCSFLLVALCVRLLNHSTRDRWFWPVMLFTVLYASAAKLAYLPLAFLPVACALMVKAPRRTLIGAAAVALATVVVLLAWSGVIREFVFPISMDLRVDPPSQVAFIRHNPITFSEVIVRSIISRAHELPMRVAGSLLCAQDVLPPESLLLFALLVAAFAMVYSGSRYPNMVLRIIALIIICAGGAATFVFLYIQNSAAGGAEVEGYQGRYLIPLLPVLALVVPPIPRPEGMTEIRMRQIVGLGGSVSVLALAAFLTLRAW
ncbi:DUF2142 domain-containing protein [Sphingomonas sp. MA1305]|nr:DUF2142 domain-containing protein [Sphingomonas sp. MA1305]